MTTPALPKVSDYVSALPLARIDSEDEFFARPLREYFSANGCEIATPESPGAPITYHIIVGTLFYVKAILSKVRHPEARRLVILWEGGERDVEEMISEGYKVVFTDPKELHREKVVSLMRFLITSAQSVLELRVELPRTNIWELYEEAPKPTHRHPMTAIHPSPSPGRERQIPDQPIEIKGVRDANILSESDKQRIETTIAEVFRPKHAAPIVSARKPIPKWIWRMPLMVLFGVCTLVITYIASVFATALLLVQGARTMNDGNVDAGIFIARAGEYTLRISESLLPVVGLPFVFTDSLDVVHAQERLLSVYRDVASVYREVNEVISASGIIAQEFLNGDQSNPRRTTLAQEVVILRKSVYSMRNSLAFAQANIRAIVSDRPFPFGSAVAVRELTRAEHALIKVRRVTSALDAMLMLYPTGGGFRQKQQYLVLFQNSMELRPTGGFIGSLALATLEGGKLIDLNVQDVYAVDGQLKGHVDPPEAVRTFLDQEHWYLRDSNWHPDFRESAKQAAWFYEKETGISVDGVIAISVPFVTRLLAVTGPIELPDYNDRITAENFFGKSLYYTQNDFFPGSTQKKDFLGSLVGAIMGKVTTAKGVSPAKIFQAILSSLESRDILMSFTDPELSQIADVAAWSGRVPTGLACRDSADRTCLDDYLALVEANVSVNKVNYFVKRHQLTEIDIDPEGAVTKTVTMSYHNEATGEPGTGGGNYRTYTRVIAPKSVQMTEILLNGVAIPQRNRETSLPTVPFVDTEDAIPGYATYVVAMDVPPSGDAQLILRYRLGEKLSFSGGVSQYALLEQKQPGSLPTDYRVVMNYPGSWTVTGAEGDAGEPFIANAGRVEYNTPMTRDPRLRVWFFKK